jgi:hypothetical protein
MTHLNASVVKRVCGQMTQHRIPGNVVKCAFTTTLKDAFGERDYFDKVFIISIYYLCMYVYEINRLKFQKNKTNK